MKNPFFLFLLLFPLSVFAQSTGSLSVFSENGDKFILYLDGIRQNDLPQSNIRVQSVPDLYYAARIVFLDSSLKPLTKNNLYVSNADDVMMDATYKLQRDKSGRPRLNFYRMVNVQDHFVPGPGVFVYNFGKPSVAETAPEPVAPDTIKLAGIGDEKKASLRVFSANGDKFFLFLNGVKQNDIAQSNIRVQNLVSQHYNVKIIFKDNRLPLIVKNNLFVADADDQLMDATYRVRKDKQGKPKLNFFSMLSPDPAYQPKPGDYVVEFGKAGTNTNKPLEEPKSSPVLNKPVAKITLLPSKTVGATTITTKKGQLSTPKDIAVAVPKPAIKDAVIPIAKPVASVKTATISKCNGWPMGKADLETAKKNIGQATGEEEKLTAAQEMISSNCLLSGQVLEFCNMFSQEKTKLAFAKFAYKFTIDRKNYGEVNKAFSKETNRKDLLKYISNLGG